MSALLLKLLAIKIVVTMAAIYFSLLCCILTFFLSSKSLAQLTGTITSPGNGFIITIDITNPTANTISILKWNNVFDNYTETPLSFSVQDDQGSVTQFAQTYVMRSGITNNDLYALGPGQKFSRIYDMRSFLQNVPSGPSPYTQKVISIIPPTSLQGVSSNGAYNVPSQAAANLAAGRLGNYADAGLGEIGLSVNTLKLAYTFPIYQNSPPDNTDSPDGVKLDTVTCSGQNASDMNDAIADAAIYAKSAGLAASDMTNTFFTQFFKSEQRSSVEVFANNALKALQGGVSYHIDVYCSDIQSLCDPGGHVLGYSYTPSFAASFVGDPYIILCPAARNLGRAPDPCSTVGGKQMVASASHVMFHLVMTMTLNIGGNIGGNYYGVQSCQTLPSSTTVDVTANADSYAQLGIAQWGYGLGGAPYTGQACLPVNGTAPPNVKRSNDVAKKSSEEARLTSGPHELARRQDMTVDDYIQDALTNGQVCSGVQAALLAYAADNARAMAAAARDSKDDDLFKQFFTDVSLRSLVGPIFDAVAKWNTTGDDAGVSFRCDPRRKTQICKYGTEAAALGQPASKTLYLVVCPSFFNSPASLQCEVPSTSNPYLTDQAVSVMHELLHVRWLVNRNIGDGWSPQFGQGACYDYNCAVANAQNARLPATDLRNYPVNVMANYQYYAIAVRAATTDCSWTTWAGSMFGMGSLSGRRMLSRGQPYFEEDAYASSDRRALDMAT